MPTYDHAGLDVTYQWNTNPNSWDASNSESPKIQDSSVRRTVFLFPDAQVLPGSLVSSAEFYLEAFGSSYEGSVQVWVGLAGDLPDDPHGQSGIDPRPTSTYVREYLRAEGTTWDLTALVQEAANDPSRTVGAPIAAVLWTTSSSRTYAQRVSGRLVVDWISPMIEADAAPAPLDLGVPAVTAEQEFRATAIATGLDLIVPAPSVQAPRALAPAPVRLDFTVDPLHITGTGQGPAPAAEPAALIVTTPPALISISTPPPPEPPPWQEAVNSPAYLAALVARSATIDTRVDIVDDQDTVIAHLGGPDATHPGVVGGTVDMDTARETRWSCSLTIDQAGLIPTSPGDLLHPLSHNRIRVWWRILTDPATDQWAEIPVGTFYPTWPDVSDDGGADPSVSVSGADVAQEISRAQMGSSVTIGGQSVAEAVDTILATAAPWARLNLDATEHRLPAEYEAGEPGADPWKVCTELADQAGLVLHADRMGAVRLTKTPDPSAAPVAEFIEGPGCVMTGATARVPLDQVRNRITISSTATQDADGEELDPVVSVASIDDATHPLWVGHGYYYDERIETDAVTTQAQADEMAAAELAKRSALAEESEIVIAPFPHLDGGDVVQVSAHRTGLTGARQVSAWSMTLGDLGGMRVTLNGRRDW